MAWSQKFRKSEISLDNGSERKTQNPAGVDSVTPDPVPHLLHTVYTRLLAALFFLEYGLYFACGLYAQRTQTRRGTKFSISNSLDGTEDDILWTDVRDNTHDTDEEDDTYDDLPYL